VGDRLAGVGRSGTAAFYWAQVLARLKPGVAPQQVRAKLANRWRRLLSGSLPPARFKGAQRAELMRMPLLITSGANGLDYFLRDRFRQPVASLLAISALVLLVACINAANLLLAQGLERRREIALRLALGARRSRVVCQLISEGALLIIAGFCWRFSLVPRARTFSLPTWVDSTADFRWTLGLTCTC
jgi:hypothetical protein